MDAVWFVRGRQIFSRIRFLTSIIGYDPRDRSISQRIYLIYLIFFFSLWGFAVLVLFAEWGVVLLAFFHEKTPIIPAINLILISLFLDLIIRCFRYSRQSPFIFTDEDATLICQTPVDRRKVALAWMLGDWFPTMLSILVFAVVLRFATLQIIEIESIQWVRLPSIWLKAMQVASIIIPMHLGLSAFAYTIGAFRLRDERDSKITRLIPFGIMAVSLLTIFTTNPGLKRLQLFVSFPLRSGFGEINWFLGFFWTLMFGVFLIWILFQVSVRLNLSRAAQESRLTSQSLLFNILGNSRTHKLMMMRRRLGVGKMMSRIPGGEGGWAIFWKNLVSSLRTLTISQVGAGLGIVGTGLVMLNDQSWEIQIGAIIIWTLLISQKSSEGLRSCLEMWVVNRQLPILGRDLMILEMSLPLFGTVFLTLLGFVLGRLLGYSTQWFILGLIPGMVLGVALFSGVDILRQSKSEDLLVGLTADVSAVGVGLSIIYTLAMIAFAWWIIREPLRDTMVWTSAVLVALFSYAVSYLLLRLVGYYFKKI